MSRRFSFTLFSVPVLAVVMASLTFLDGAQTPQSSTDAAAPQQAARPQQPTGPQQLAWVDRSGKVSGPIGQPQDLITDTALSPDGSRVAVRGQEQNNDDIWIHDMARGTKTRITFHPAAERQPGWSPSGDRVVYFSYRNNDLADLFIHAADGSGEETLLVAGPGHDYAPNWSQDGKYLIYHVHDPATDNRDLWYVPMTGSDRQPRPFLQTPPNAKESLPKFSPDGRYVAYQSNESGRMEVYVRPFPSGDGKWQVSANGGWWPKWSSQGGELFFFEGNILMTVPVKTQSTFTMGTPQKLFTAEQAGMGTTSGYNPTYDVTADGKRFVVVQVPRQSTPSTPVMR